MDKSRVGFERRSLVQIEVDFYSVARRAYKLLVNNLSPSLQQQKEYIHQYDKVHRNVNEGI